ncbi:hypothetical protein EDD15DRAFT_2167773, partial [Pisolithus albus]
ETLLYWICGEDSTAVRRVEISSETDVADLRNALKKERSDTLGNVDAKNLKLYPLFVPSDVYYEDEVEKWRLHGKRPLCATQKLSSVFPATREGLWLVVVHHRAPPRLYDNFILTPS